MVWAVLVEAEYINSLLNEHDILPRDMLLTRTPHVPTIANIVSFPNIFYSGSTVNPILSFTVEWVDFFVSALLLFVKIAQ